MSINVVNNYSVAYTNLMLSTSTEVKTSADALQPATIAVPAAWKTPLFTHKTDTGATTSDYKVRAELDCTNESDEYKIAGDFTVNAEGWQLPAPLTVPVGWNCQIDLNQPLFKIPGADLVDSSGLPLSADAASGANFTWDAVGGSGTAATQSGLRGALVTKAGTDPNTNSLALHIPYRMQLGSFNLKKKVGGEGVSMIPGDHQFKVDYSCTLNGVPIPIPTARPMSNSQDVIGTFKNDLQNRLQSVGSTAGAQNMKMGRFQQGEWHPIDALPAGAVCAVSEDSTVAERPHSKWDNYWELTPGFRSREPIVSNCETLGTELCSYQDPGSKAVALVKLPRDAGTKNNKYWSDKDNPSGSTNPIVPQTLPENFAGTMVPWNNYTFEKTRVKVHLTVDGNGKRLGAGKAVSLRLYCKPPSLVANEVTIEGNGGNAAAIYNTTLKLTPSTSDPYTATGISDVFVPVDYNCVIAQTRPETYDASVDYVLHNIRADTSTILTADISPTDPNPLQTLKDQLAKYDGTNDLFGTVDVNGGTVDGVTHEADGNLLPTQEESILKGFRVHPNYVVPQGAPQKFTEFDLTNTYNRPEANLWVNAKLDTEASEYEENVGSRLTIPGYKISYTCTDAVLREPAVPPATEGTPVTYTGTVEVDSSGTPVQIRRSSDDILPATATCSFEIVNAGADPIGAYPTLRHRLSAELSETTDPGGEQVRTQGFKPQFMGTLYPCPTPTEPNKQCPTQKSDLSQYKNANEVVFDAAGKNRSTLTFTNAYLVQKADVSVVAYPEGTRAKALLARSTTQYPYNYTCSYPQLPGYDSTGSGTLRYEKITVDESVTPPVTTSTWQDAKAAQLARAIVPVGSTCTVVPQSPTPDLSGLEAQNLKHITAFMTPPLNQLLDPITKLPRSEPAFTDVLDPQNGTVTWSAANRAPIPAAGFTMQPGDDPRVVMHAIYRNKVNVQVRKVDKEFQTAIDTEVSFKIYPVKANGDLDSANPIDVTPQKNQNGNDIPGVFAAALEPGGYALEETKSGRGEMLPTYWNFTVSPKNHLDGNQKFDPYTDFGDDLTVKLADYVSHTGMVAVNPPLTDTQPWSIDVAEVSSGYLPKTGGARLWVEITGLLMLAGGLALAYRRKTLLKENH